ncbi:hypothetical protein QIH13_28095, partial [Klebsiella pneumoniae]|nr:hypothetical protein [Klebsiella pneumoniae]
NIQGNGFIGMTLSNTLEYIITKIIDIRKIINRILNLDILNFKSTRLSSVKSVYQARSMAKTANKPLVAIITS